MAEEKKYKRKETAIISKVNFNIKKRREQLSISQKELEIQTGLKIYKYESGQKDMTITTLAIIANSLKTEPYSLLK